MGRWIRYLLEMIPITGRQIRENGEHWNRADWGYVLDLEHPGAATFRKKAHQFNHFRTEIVSGDVYYYSFINGPKHMVVYSRTLEVGEGPVNLEFVFGATYTPGTPVNMANIFIGGPNSDVIATAGATNVVGGVTIPLDYVFSGGNKVPGSAGAAGLPTIIPPGFELLIKITNIAPGTNPGIKLTLSFTEIDIPEGLI